MVHEGPPWREGLVRRTRCSQMHVTKLSPSAFRDRGVHVIKVPSRKGWHLTARKCQEGAQEALRKGETSTHWVLGPANAETSCLSVLVENSSDQGI